MESITIKDFVALTQTDEVLKKRIMNIEAKGKSAKSELVKLASDYGYDLIVNPELEIVDMSDEELDQVSGGGKKILPKEQICYEIFTFFGFDAKKCFD